MKPLSEQDYYEVLEVGRDAGRDEIERAYRLACATYTEDSLAGYSVFEDGDVGLIRDRLDLAYRTLSDPEERAAYDRSLAKAEVAPVSASASDPATLAETNAATLEPLEAFEELDEQGGEFDGSRLRRTRLRHGLELEDIAGVTKVNPTYLRFLEEERFDGLPAAVYVRGFVMGYASCLGLDPKAVAKSYMQRYSEPSRREKRSRFARR